MKARTYTLTGFVLVLLLSACAPVQMTPTHFVCMKDDVTTVDVTTINGAEEIVLVPGTSPIWTWKDATGDHSIAAVDAGICSQKDIE